MKRLIQLSSMMEILGDNPSQEQEKNLVSWIVDYIPQVYWRGLLDSLTDYDAAYTELSMRCGELGI